MTPVILAYGIFTQELKVADLTDDDLSTLGLTRKSKATEIRTRATKVLCDGFKAYYAKETMQDEYERLWGVERTGRAGVPVEEPSQGGPG